MKRRKLTLPSGSPAEAKLSINREADRNPIFASENS